jgi:hypothetical protein
MPSDNRHKARQRNAQPDMQSRAIPWGLRRRPREDGGAGSGRTAMRVTGIFDPDPGGKAIARPCLFADALDDGAAAGELLF